MMLSHSSCRWLAVAALLAGCKSNPPAEAARPTAPVPAEKPRSAPAAEAGPALSLLLPVAPQRCTWARQPLPGTEATPVFTFDAACDESRVSWSPDAKEGLVFSYAVNQADARAGVWRVDLASRTGKPLELKGLPFRTETPASAESSLRRVAFDTQGRLVALVALTYPRGEGNPTVITFGGQRYPVQVEGGASPRLALAYRLEGAQWKQFEAKASAESDDMPQDPSLDVLEAAKTLREDSSEALPGQEAPAGARQKLDAAVPGQDAEGKWMALPTPGGPLYYRAAFEPDEETFFVAPTFRWEREGSLVALEGMPEKASGSASLQLQQDRLLILLSLAEVEGRMALVYDTRTKTRLATARDLTTATLWPTPAAR